MRNEIESAIDGFGRDAEESDEWIPEDERQYSELRWENTKALKLCIIYTEHCNYSIQA